MCCQCVKEHSDLEFVKSRIIIHVISDSRIFCIDKQLNISRGVTLIGPRTASILIQFHDNMRT